MKDMSNETPTTPFAMRCTQEQFDDVKEELRKYQEFYAIFPFNDYPVLHLDEEGVTNTSERHCKDNSLLLYDWDKSLFLKMAGKPEPESRELIGYKINPAFDLTYKDLEGLLRCEFYDMHDDIWRIKNCEGVGSEFFARAIELGIVGEGKWLIPVYKEDTPVSSRITGTYEQQKGGEG